MNLKDKIIGMIISPGKTIKDISGKPHFGEALLIVGITAVFYSISAYLMQSKIIYDFGDTGGLDFFNFMTTVVPVVMPLISTFINWIIAAGFINLISVALGGKGKFIQTLVMYGYAYIPIILSLVIEIILMSFMDPITLSVSTIGANNANSMVDFMSNPLFQISFITSIFLKLWSIGLVFIGVKHIHGLSANQAFITVALPLLFLVYHVLRLMFSMALMG